MVQPFPDHPYLTGYYRPFRAELDAEDLVIEGALPDGLSGVFYRNGPDPRYAPKEGDKYHPFDGDGMVYAIRLENGSASLRNRWVRTRKFSLERAAGRRLFGVCANPRFNDPSVSFMDYNTANTHIWPHGGRLFALMEGCLPEELDPDTLATLGPQSFDGAIQGPFTAHPKTDPDSGALYSFGYQAKGPFTPDVRYNIQDAAGRVIHSAHFQQPYASMMHDFMVTGSRVAFPCLPLSMDMQRAMQGKPPTAWEPEKPACFGVMAKEGDGSGLRWVETDPTFTYHFANAYDDGDAVMADAVMSRAAPLMPNADGSPPDPAAWTMRLGRWTIPTNSSGSFREEILDDMELQFPRIDDRRMGKTYRYVFANGSSKPMAGRSEGFDTILRFDLKRGKRDAYHAGEHAHCGEPIFAPRPGSSTEGDGWLLCLVWYPQANRSALLVFDAMNLSVGPQASVQAPARSPGGFHCHWRPL